MVDSFQRHLLRVSNSTSQESFKLACPVGEGGTGRRFPQPFPYFLDSVRCRGLLGEISPCLSFQGSYKFHTHPTSETQATMVLTHLFLVSPLFRSLLWIWKSKGDSILIRIRALSSAVLYGGQIVFRFIRHLLPGEGGAQPRGSTNGKWQ